jgi:hypothetical protein
MRKMCAANILLITRQWKFCLMITKIYNTKKSIRQTAEDTSEINNGSQRLFHLTINSKRCCLKNVCIDIITQTKKESPATRKNFKLSSLRAESPCSRSDCYRRQCTIIRYDIPASHTWLSRFCFSNSFFCLQYHFVIFDFTYIAMIMVFNFQREPPEFAETHSVIFSSKLYFYDISCIR